MSQSAGAAAEHVIQYEPHYKSVTEQGRSHFIRPADALAELIDNSMQYSAAARSLITVSFHLVNRFSAERSFVVVADNGCGMDVEGIKAFATFALDQQARDLVPTDVANSRCISKFGVGAKQAGFYLGSNINILTKPQGSPNVLNFIMDEGVFEQRYQRRQSVYTDTVHFFASSEDYERKREESLRWPHSVWESVHQHSQESSFTVIVIELRNVVKDLLLDANSGSAVLSDLADIYYFHLHPIIPTAQSPPEITYVVYVDEKEYTHQRLDEDPSCLTHQYFRDRQDHFLFTIDVPDPVALVQKPAMGQSSQLAQLGIVRRHKVSGIINYYPYLDDHETHPRFRDDDTASIRFHVYWQNRLVPQSTWSSLPFFNKVKDIKGLSEHWHQRIQGFLFFDWTFEHISNNKLKLLVSPDFQQWINSRPVFDESLPCKHCERDFTKFLQRCALADREFTFTDRIVASVDRGKDNGKEKGKGKGKAKDDSGAYEDGKSYFRTVSYRDGLMLSVGDQVKWKDADGIPMYGQIVDLVVDRNLPPEQPLYRGTGSFRFSCLPADILGQHLDTAALTVLCSAENLATLRYTAEDEATYRSQLPASVSIARIVTDGDVEQAQSIAEYLVDPVRYSLYVQLLDHSEAPTVSLPHRSNKRNERYEVHLSLVNQHGAEAALGSQNRLYELDKDEECTHVRTRLQDLYFRFQDIKIREPGPHYIKVKVFSRVSGRSIEIFEAALDIAVVSMVPRGVELATLSAPRLVTLGSALPALSIQLTDGAGALAMYSGAMHVRATVESHHGLRLEQQSHSLALCGADQGKVVLPEGALVLVMDPVVDVDLDSPSAVHGKGTKVRVAMEFTISLAGPNSTQDVTLLSSVDFTIVPGPPRRLVWANESAFNLVKQNCALPKARVAWVDVWGNRCASAPGKKWRWKIVSEQGLVAAAEGDVKGDEIKLPLLWAESAAALEESRREQLELTMDAEGCEPLHIAFTVHPSRLPSQLRLWRGAEHVDKEVVGEAGSTIDDLHFEVLDAQGQVIEDWADWVEKSSLMECSWAMRRGKRKKEQVPADGRLPPLHVPRSTCESLDCDVELTMDGAVVHSNFAVRATPGGPTSWKILLDESFGLRADALRAKLHGVCCVDKHDNIVPSWPENLATAMEMVLTGAEGDLQVVDLMRARLRWEGMEVDGFVVAEDVTLSDAFAPGSRVSVAAVAADSFLGEAEALSLTVVAGRPAALALLAPSLGLKDAATAATVSVAQFSRLSDITLVFQDARGRLASLDELEVELRVLRDGDEVTYHPRQIPHARTTVALDTSLDALFCGPESELREVMLAFEARVRSTDGLVDLPRAVLRCQPVKLDNITGLDVTFMTPSSQREGLVISDDDGRFTVQLVAGTTFPDLLVAARTDNGSPFAHRAQDFKLKLKDDRAQKAALVDLFQLVAGADGDVVMVQPVEGPALETFCRKVGQAELKVTYTESRPAFAHLDRHFKEHSLRVKVSVLPAPPAKLVLAAGSKLESSVVTNSRNEDWRALVRRFRLEVLDEFGNACDAEALRGGVSCHVEQSPARASVVDRPLLEGAERGSVEAERRGAHFVFAQLSVDARSTCSAGIYYLAFSYADATRMLAASLPFEYAPQEQYSAEKVRLEGELTALLERQERLAQLRERVKQLKAQRREDLRTASDTLRNAADDLATLRSLHGNRLSQLSHLQRGHTAPRPAERRVAVDPVAMAQSGCLGTVTDLAYVNDVFEARVLSFAARRHMDALVVKTAEQAQCLYARGVKAWALELVKPFRMRTRENRTRERTDEERDRGALPLPAITIGKDPAPGNPQYLVNVLRLDEAREGLRDTVFHSIFGAAVIFDRLEHALRYRAHCVEAGASCAALFTRAGERVDSHGLLDPADKVPDALDYVFGEQPVQHTREYVQELQATERESAALERLIALSEELQEMQRQRAELEGAGLDESVAALRLKLRQMCHALSLTPAEVVSEARDAPFSDIEESAS